MAGQPNLYVREGGQARFIATLAAADRTNCGPCTDATSPAGRLSRLSADGSHLAFTSQSAALAEQVAGYDNTDLASGHPDNEVYLYDAPAGHLLCASCKPSGARPAGGALGPPEAPVPTAAYIPGWQWSNVASRVLSTDGSRLFFDSFDALTPADTNGEQDVYEWEAPGAGPPGGRCSTASPTYSHLNGGCVSLISSGKSPAPSRLLDSSADGRDAFFATASSLDPRDPGLIDVYDAREGGGYPPPPPPPTPCLGDSCRAVPPVPQASSPSSLGFQGPGNLPTTHAKRCPRGKVRVHRHGKRRCVKRRRRRHAHHRHKRRHAKARRHGARRAAR